MPKNEKLNRNVFALCIESHILPLQMQDTIIRRTIDTL